MNGGTPERVLLCLRNGVWMEGSAAFLREEGLVNFVNDASCNFLPLTDVQVYRSGSEERTEIDFLAVNVEDITFVTVLSGEDDSLAREEIVTLVTANGSRSVPQTTSADTLMSWLDEEVISRLNICQHLLGNGRVDDRSAGIKLVLQEIIAEIRRRTRDIESS